MLAYLDEVNGRLARELAGAEPERVRPVDAARVFAALSETERLAGALKLLFTTRAADAMVWRDAGHRSAASWMAEQAKTPLGAAVSAVETAQALRDLPETTEALRRGELSGAQAGLIARAASRHPRAERELVAAAAGETLKGLKERCAQVRAAASSAREEAERYLAIRKRRSVRHWTDEEGAFRLDARLTPDDGATVLASLRTWERRCFEEARTAGEELAPGAALADALVRMADRGPASGEAQDARAGRAGIAIRVDATALMRGHTEPGERCAIPGVGPVPVAVVRRLLPESFVKVLVADGVDVHSVVHVGRTVPAHVESALEERDPVCVVPGCDVAHGLEKHHWAEDFATCGTTSLAGLARICSWHHDLVTYEGYVLRGGPGSWELTAPDDGGGGFDSG